MLVLPVLQIMLLQDRLTFENDYNDSVRAKKNAQVVTIPPNK